MHEISELKVFKSIRILSEISNNLPNNLLGTKYTRLSDDVDNHC